MATDLIEAIERFEAALRVLESAAGIAGRVDPHAAFHAAQEDPHAADRAKAALPEWHPDKLDPPL